MGPEQPDLRARRRAGGAAARAGRRRPTSVPIFDGRPADGWRVEHDPTSLAAVDVAPIVGGAELRFRYGLAGGAPVGQVAALAVRHAGAASPPTIA